MTDRLIRELKQAIDAFTLIPSDGGKFEVTVDDELVYSKVQTGSFPDEDALVAEITGGG